MLRKRFIPHNYLQGKRILGFRKRNFFEGLAWAFVALLIIGSIPFVTKVRWILTICIGIFLVIMNGIGIRGQSYSQALINMFHYRKYLKPFTYRRLNYANKEPEPLFETVNSKQKVRTIRENSKLEQAKKLIRR